MRKEKKLIWLLNDNVLMKKIAIIVNFKNDNQIRA